VGYTRDLGHHSAKFSDDLIVAAVECPLAFTLDRVIWALEVKTPTMKELDEVYPMRKAQK
jgi:hypothetical protein